MLYERDLSAVYIFTKCDKFAYVLFSPTQNDNVNCTAEIIQYRLTVNVGVMQSFACFARPSREIRNKVGIVMTLNNCR